ncbi:plasmid transfer protein [Sphingobacterium shayense]|uniref:plasmid transfer protein n=1 Tax=Sphingobacterium shayense TaxID=626343 RepID=UPI001555F7E8|nr:plasmid transfer protein [Sphingobacterium shayense]NQD72325.1 plasmid transfer protein [Sphingobacterium shayense]
MHVFNQIPLVQVNPVDVPESFKETFGFLQGNGVYDAGALHFFRSLKDTIWTHYDTFISDAQALAAIFMLIYFAIRCYEMMAGDKKLEIMPLLRPFGLVMIILWWSPFTRAVAFPTDIIAAKAEAVYEGGQDEVNGLRLQRAKLMIEVADQLTKIEAQTEIAAKEADVWYEEAWQSVTSTVKEGFAQVWNPIVELRNRMQVGIQLLATYTLETLAIWILRLCVYIIFIIQIIYSTVLIILGPFSVAASILPIFKDSFSNWLSRFISVNLYTGIAFLVMYISSLFQQYALSAEITRYQELVGTQGANMEKLAYFAGNGLLSFGIVIIAFLIGGLSMLTVPSISTWIVSTSGVTSAASAFGRGASSAAGKARKALAKI